MAFNDTDRKGSAMTKIRVFIFSIDFATGLDLCMALNSHQLLRSVDWGDGLPPTVSGTTDDDKFWVALADGREARRICQQFVGTVPNKIHPVVAGKVIPR
jgi:hypothetical protein